MRLILIPSLITLAVTILRVVGELEHWPEGFFGRAGGGGTAIVGIVWLVPIFGIYFALKLTAANGAPRSFARAFMFVIPAAVLMQSRPFLAQHFLPHGISLKGWLMFLWSLAVLAALLALPAWPRLWKILLAYGFAARVPVAVVILFALRGNWGTHYDSVAQSFQAMGLFQKWLWLGISAQVFYWVAFTLVAGMLFGTIAGAIARAMRRPVS